MKAHLPTCEPDQCHCPPEATRYFTDGTSIWKFTPGELPAHRYADEGEWDESAFLSFEEFSQSPGDTREITAEEGEA